MTRSDPAALVFSAYRFPDLVRVDELLIRGPEEADVELIAPAFVDPEVGGEAGLPPVGPEALRAFMREQMAPMRAQGLLAAYVVADADGTVLGGLTLHHFDPMRDAVEVGYWLFREARGRGAAVVRSAPQSAASNAAGRNRKRDESILFARRSVDCLLCRRDAEEDLRERRRHFHVVRRQKWTRRFVGR